MDTMNKPAADFQLHYPDFAVTELNSKTPYSSTMRIKQDRRNPSRTKRPLNAFMLFAKLQRDHLTGGVNCNHSEISKELGRLWQRLDRAHKEPFMRGAKLLMELHRREFPEYKYRPRKRSNSSKTSSTSSVTRNCARRSSHHNCASSGSSSWTSEQKTPTTSSSVAAELDLWHERSSDDGELASDTSRDHDEAWHLTTDEVRGGGEAETVHLCQPSYTTPVDLTDIDICPLDEFNNHQLGSLHLFPALELTCDDFDCLKSTF